MDGGAFLGLELGLTLLPVKHDLDVLVDLWFVVGEAANFPGGDNLLFTKPDVVSDTLSEALTKVIL